MPKTALISDIHGNIDALESALADIDQQGITEILCLGDIVGYGAAPGSCRDRPLRADCAMRRALYPIWRHTLPSLAEHGTQWPQGAWPGSWA